MTCLCWAIIPIAMRTQHGAYYAALHLELAHPDVVDWLLEGTIDVTLRLLLEILKGTRTP